MFNREFVCAYGVRVYIRTYALPHIVLRFNIMFQIVSVIFQIVHVATVALRREKEPKELLRARRR